MNTRILSIAALSIAVTSQAHAMSNSGWSLSAAYGVQMPIDAKSTGWDVKDGQTPAVDVPVGTMKLKNPNYFDVALSHTKSGFGLMYSSTAKDTKFETSVTPTKGEDKFTWKYNGVFATYNHPLGQMLDLTLAVGSVKQSFDNTLVTGKEVSKRDLGARVGVGAFYNLSKEASLKLGLSYNYFKEFTTAFDTGTATPAANIKTATPKFDASSLSASIALVYVM